MPDVNLDSYIHAGHKEIKFDSLTVLLCHSISLLNKNSVTKKKT